MNNHKGFSLVELIIVIAILGIFGTAVFSLIVVGTRSYRNVGNDSDIQNEAQLTVNQIENLVIDTTKAITYSYTAGGTTTKVLSDNGIGEVDGKTLTVYNSDAIYIIDWIKADKKIYLQKNTVDNTGTVTGTGDRVEMAENVSAFSVSLEKAQAKNKVYVDVEFLSSDGTSSYVASKQIALRNVLAINDTTGAYDEPNVASSVTGIQIYYDGLNYSEDTVSYFSHGEQNMTFSFSALVRGVNFPSQQVSWAVTGNSSENTTISNAGQLTIGEDEDFSNTLTVKVTSTADPNYYTWANVKIKKITGVNLEIDSASRADEYHYADVITVKASITGDNLEDVDKKFNWSATGAQRLDTYPADGNIQEYKIKATVGNNFTINAVSATDSNFHDSISFEVANPYGVTIAWDGTASDKLLRKGTTNSIKATVEPNDGQYGDIRWEICYIENTTSGTNETESLSSTVAKDDKISLTSYRGDRTSIYCGKSVDWNSKYTVGVRAYIVVNGQYMYSEPIYISMDNVFIRIWYGSNSADIRTNDPELGHKTWVNGNSNISYNYGVYGYYCSPGTVAVISASENYVLNLGYNDSVCWFKTADVKSTNTKTYDAKIKFQIDGITWGYIHSYINK